ncbi:tetratricopeptide repeat protein [bacterium]|nr:tetratricopeptide repeat protein [bacterium]MBR5625119.1 tetratricopeptide repeat protein [bacterium]
MCGQKIKIAAETGILWLCLVLGYSSAGGELDELDSAGLFRFTYASLKRGEATNAFFAARTFLARYGEEEEMTNYFPRMTYFGGLAAYRIKRFEEASDLFAKAGKEYPAFSEAKNARFGFGMAEMELGHYLIAADAFRNLLQEGFGDAAEVKANLALSLTKAGRYEEALPYWEEVKEVKKFRALSSLNLSWCLLEIGKADAALSWLREGLALNKKEDSASLRNYLALRMGDVLYMSNNFSGALSAYRLADKASCGEARLARLARACYDACYYPECAVYCEEGIRTTTNDFVKVGLKKLACYACLQGGYLDRLERGVAELLREKLKEDELEALALLPAQGALRATEYQRARDRFLEFAKKYPSSELLGEAKLYAACALGFLGEEKAALAETEAWLAAFGEEHKLSAEAMYWKGMLAYYQVLDEEAQATFSAFKQKYPKNSHLADVEFRLAAILYRREDYLEAQKALRAVLERYPEYDNLKEVKNTLGDALGATGELTEALAAYRGNLPQEKEKPDNFACYALLKAAEIYEVLGRPRLAMELLEPYLLAEGTIGFRGEALSAYLCSCRILGEKEKARSAAWKLWLRTKDELAEGEALGALTAGLQFAEDAGAYKEALLKEAALELEKGKTGAYAKISLFLKDDAGLGKLKYQTLGPEGLRRRLILAKEKQGGEAEKLAKYLTEEFPKDPAASEGWLCLAERCVEKARYAEAEAYLLEGEESYQRIEDLYRRDELQGRSFFNQGKTEEALQKFLALLGQKGLPPEKKAALLLLAGDCYIAGKKYGEALGYYQRVYVMYQGEKKAVKEAYEKSLVCFQALGRTNDWAATEKEAKEKGYL